MADPLPAPVLILTGASFIPIAGGKWQIKFSVSVKLNRFYLPGETERLLFYNTTAVAEGVETYNVLYWIPLSYPAGMYASPGAPAGSYGDPYTYADQVPSAAVFQNFNLATTHDALFYAGTILFGFDPTGTAATSPTQPGAMNSPGTSNLRPVVIPGDAILITTKIMDISAGGSELVALDLSVSVPHLVSYGINPHGGAILAVQDGDTDLFGPASPSSFTPYELVSSIPPVPVHIHGAAYTQRGTLPCVAPLTQTTTGQFLAAGLLGATRGTVPPVVDGDPEGIGGGGGPLACNLTKPQIRAQLRTFFAAHPVGLTFSPYPGGSWHTQYRLDMSAVTAWRRASGNLGPFPCYFDPHLSAYKTATDANAALNAEGIYPASGALQFGTGSWIGYGYGVNAAANQTPGGSQMWRWNNGNAMEWVGVAPGSDAVLGPAYLARSTDYGDSFRLQAAQDGLYETCAAAHVRGRIILFGWQGKAGPWLPKTEVGNWYASVATQGDQGAYTWGPDKIITSPPVMPDAAIGTDPLPYQPVLGAGLLLARDDGQMIWIWSNGSYRDRRGGDDGDNGTDYNILVGSILAVDTDGTVKWGPVRRIPGVRGYPIAATLSRGRLLLRYSQYPLSFVSERWVLGVLGSSLGKYTWSAPFDINFPPGDVGSVGPGTPMWSVREDGTQEYLTSGVGTKLAAPLGASVRAASTVYRLITLQTTGANRGWVKGKAFGG